MAGFMDTFAGRKPLQKNALNRMREMSQGGGGLLVLAGKPGSGKSAFTVRNSFFLLTCKIQCCIMKLINIVLKRVNLTSSAILIMVNSVFQVIRKKKIRHSTKVVHRCYGKNIMQV